MEKGVEATVMVLRLWWCQRLCLGSFCARIVSTLVYVVLTKDLPLYGGWRGSVGGSVQDRCCCESNWRCLIYPNFNPCLLAHERRVLNGKGVVEEFIQLKLCCSDTRKTLSSWGRATGEIQRFTLSRLFDEVNEMLSNTSNGNVHVYPLSSLLC
jgi:hypothetical protein